MSHSFFAAVLASLRRFTPSLLSTLLTWLLTVETRMFRISPISALLFRADQLQHLHLRCRQCLAHGKPWLQKTGIYGGLCHFAFPDHSSASSSGSTAAP